MTDAGVSAPPAAQPLGHEPRKRSQRFRRAADTPTLDADQRRRQTAVMQAAVAALGSRDAIMAFLNTHRDELGGRPLDVAVDSDAGLARVDALLAGLG